MSRRGRFGGRGSGFGGDVNRFGWSNGFGGGGVTGKLEIADDLIFLLLNTLAYGDEGAIALAQDNQQSSDEAQTAKNKRSLGRHVEERKGRKLPLGDGLLFSFGRSLVHGTGSSDG